MSAIIKFVAPAELLFQPVEEKKRVSANREARLPSPSSICEPERRFWKLAARTASPKFAIIEGLVLGLFLVLALVAIVACFGELSHLLESDALGHVAMKAIGGGA
jgi:hypothetical protein